MYFQQARSVVLSTNTFDPHVTMVSRNFNIFVFIEREIYNNYATSAYGMFDPKSEAYNLVSRKRVSTFLKWVMY